MASVIDIFLYHTIERKLFDRLVHQLGKDPIVTKQVITLWLCLEAVGFREIIRNIFSRADRFLEAIMSEAEACLQILYTDSPSLPSGHNDIPVTAGLINEPLNLRFFVFNQEQVRNEMDHIMNTITNIIFDENVRRRLEGSPPRTPVEGSSSSNLNPQATPFVPRQAYDSGQRSIFLTFSRGFPIEKDDILAFFTRNWGDVVEDISLERTSPGVQPMYGRLTFKSSSTVALVLNGQLTAKFTIHGRHLWARIFEPRRR